MAGQLSVWADAISRGNVGLSFSSTSRKQHPAPDSASSGAPPNVPKTGLDFKGLQGPSCLRQI